MATGGIPVDLHTLAVSIVSKNDLKKLQSVEGSKMKSDGSSVGRGGILGDGYWCSSCPGWRGQVPRITWTGLEHLCNAASETECPLTLFCKG